MRIQESAENYLETILILQKQMGKVRSVDIARELAYSKPSISIAMKNLRESGYITVGKDGAIWLLEKGAEIAERMYERHTLLTNWLESIGVSPEAASRDACRIEHVISEECFSALRAFAEKNTLENGGQNADG